MSTGDAGSIFIFDEVDAGIGGVVAESIGKKIRNLSDESQVVCITHLPQVAKFANTHLLVAKEFGEGETDVSVDALSEEERVVEIGRMLAGKSVSEKTFEVARELIKGAVHDDLSVKSVRKNWLGFKSVSLLVKTGEPLRHDSFK